MLHGVRILASKVPSKCHCAVTFNPKRRHLLVGPSTIACLMPRSRNAPRSLMFRRVAAAPMHLKRYQIDGRLLRTGAANFSPSGLKRRELSNTAKDCGWPKPGSRRRIIPGHVYRGTLKVLVEIGNRVKSSLWLGGMIMALSGRTKLGITIAVAVIAGLASVSLAVLLLVLAVFLIAWGQIPERTEAFVKGLPGGNYLQKALARIDLILGPRGLGQEDTAPKDLQEESAHEDERNLVQEEYFRDILRGYSPTARRNLSQLRISGDPKDVLAEEWVQYLRDVLLGGMHYGTNSSRERHDDGGNPSSNTK